MTDDSTGLVDGYTDAVDDFLFDWLDDHDLPSVAAAIVTEDDHAYANAFGSRDLQANDAATADTLYGIGSVTKSFTAATVMQCVEDGILELTASPAAYTSASFDGIDDISLHELLCHSSGLPSLAVSEALIARQADLGEAAVPLGDMDDFYQYLEGVGEVVADGDRFMYCNTGYMLLAEAVAAARNKPFENVVSESILDPLDMERSTMDASKFQSDANTMTPYTSDEDDGWEPTPLPVRELSHGPGGLFSSVRELGRYLQLYLNDGTTPDGDSLLSPESIDQLTGEHADTPAGPYGYGWRRRELAGHTLIGHSGSIGVSTAYAGWSPDLGLGVAVLCNAAPGHRLAHVGEGILTAALGLDPQETLPFFARQRRHDLLEGTYESYRGVRQAEVESIGNDLSVRLTEPLAGEPVVLTFEERTDDGFQYATSTDEDRSMPVEFIVNDDAVDLFYERWRLRQPR